jgi:hypothetical protein
MRISDFIRAQISPIQAFTRPPTFVPLRYLGGALQVRGASGDQAGGDARRQQTDMTQRASRRGRLSAASPAGRGQDSVQLSGQANQALLEQFVRKRAAVSFSVPNAAGGLTNFAFEVETAYRLITPVEPGILVDAEG